MEIGSNSTENCFEHADKDTECTVVNIDDDVLGAGMRRLVAFTIGTIITVLNGHCAQENDLADDAPKYLDEKNNVSMVTDSLSFRIKDKNKDSPFYNFFEVVRKRN